MQDIQKCLTSPWIVCIDGEEFPCDKLYDACDKVMKYVGEQKLTEDLHDRVWIECGEEVINICLSSRIIKEIDRLITAHCEK